MIAMSHFLSNQFTTVFPFFLCLASRYHPNYSMGRGFLSLCVVLIVSHTRAAFVCWERISSDVVLYYAREAGISGVFHPFC